MHADTLNEVIEATALRILGHQRGDGAFVFCCEVNPLPDALMVIFLHLVGQSDDPLIPRLCRRLLRHQSSDGEWRAYPDERDSISMTTLAYFALLLSDYRVDAPEMMRAQSQIVRLGGITQVNNLVKIVLATAGQLPWSSLPASHIEFLLLQPILPLNVYDFSSYARVHMIPYMMLRHLEFHYRVPHHKSLKSLISPMASSSSLAGTQVRWTNVPALEAARQFIVDRLEPNGTIESYLTATAFSVWALQGMGFKSDHPIILRAVSGMKEMVYHGRTDVHQQVFTSTVWDTALCMRALSAANLPDAQEALRAGAKYLLSRQHTTPSDWTVHSRTDIPGGWGFSDVNTLYPDIDDTVAALTALYPFGHKARAAWDRGLQWLLGMQNSDGGWAAFDRNNNKHFLEQISINDMGRAMTDPSSVDITGRVLEAFGTFGLANSNSAVAATKWLRGQQRQDGSWYGRWGITYIYGTSAALRGLTARGDAKSHKHVQRGRQWLESIQHEDGGFGESCESDAAGQYISLPHSTASQTAWGMLGLMAASTHQTHAVKRAANRLLNTERPHGGWEETYPTGAGVAGLCYIHYHSYAYVWPMLALCEYRDKYKV